MSDEKSKESFDTNGNAGMWVCSHINKINKRRGNTLNSVKYICYVKYLLWC